MQSPGRAPLRRIGFFPARRPTTTTSSMSLVLEEDRSPPSSGMPISRASSWKEARIASVSRPGVRAGMAKDSRHASGAPPMAPMSLAAAARAFRPMKRAGVYRRSKWIPSTKRSVEIRTGEAAGQGSCAASSPMPSDPRGGRAPAQRRAIRSSSSSSPLTSSFATHSLALTSYRPEPGCPPAAGSADRLPPGSAVCGRPGAPPALPFPPRPPRGPPRCG